MRVRSSLSEMRDLSYYPLKAMRLVYSGLMWKKGGRPTSSSYAMQPSDQISIF